MVYKVGDVVIQKSSLGGALVYGSAIIMSFIGVGFSMFSLSRLQNTSGRRTVIAEVFKWYNVRPTPWSFSMFQGRWVEDCLWLRRFSAAKCYLLCFSHTAFGWVSSLHVYVCCRGRTKQQRWLHAWSDQLAPMFDLMQRTSLVLSGQKCSHALDIAHVLYSFRQSPTSRIGTSETFNWGVPEGILLVSSKWQSVSAKQLKAWAACRLN